MSLSSPNKPQLGSESGFSLIEVLISMAVLVFISLGLTQTITETFRLRDSLLNEGDFYNGIRMALEIVQRDVALLYSPTVMMPKREQKLDANGNPVLDAAEQKDLQTLLATDHGQTSDFWAPAVDRSGIRPSRFVGTDSKMTFVAASNIRIYKDTAESDFAKVTYELLPDPFDKDLGGRVLTKTESPNAFDDDARKDKDFQRIFPLLRGITKLQYRYYKKDVSQWFNSWDSDKEDFRNIYPDIIEVNIEVKGPFKLNFEGRYRFRPEVPLRGLDTTT